jgi:hypothetical protein
MTYRQQLDENGVFTGDEKKEDRDNDNEDPMIVRERNEDDNEVNI